MSKASVVAPMPSGVPSGVRNVAALAKSVNAHGLCTRVAVTAEFDPWFPATEVPEDLERLARRVCAGCPVIAECREMTLRVESDLSESRIVGIFGALAPHERMVMIRARRASAGGAR